MGSFDNISYFSVALNGEFKSFMSKRNTTSTIKIFSFLIYIFCVAIASKKHK